MLSGAEYPEESRIILQALKKNFRSNLIAFNVILGKLTILGDREEMFLCILYSELWAYANVYRILLSAKGLDIHIFLK